MKQNSTICGLYKRLSNARTIHLTSKKKTATIKKGRTYYVTVKAYKTDSLGKRVYGKSNKIFKVKLKK
ncbi:hypothetical protein [Anaerosacchariphilus polymeriproducens]|uniref:Uncharacterized protein n=1 Tax=Anaerosacchariphilus polymeriproducens TaxID=1812858 RepID=A0A371AX80_9FIRM|nr:hypothetical protein [Anaerosacchariphilus polymeriproducens]RDU24122.1 hypothetical protein DWV06_06165 [Anaerosacchariphilus polymeriproducens]